MRTNFLALHLPFYPEILPQVPANSKSLFKFYQDRSLEYLLVVSPPDFIKKDVFEYKKLLCDKIGSYCSYRSIAHLTIACFLMDKKREKALHNSLQIIAAEQSKIAFSINGFKAFKTSGTVYMLINEKKAFSNLSKNICQKTLIANISSKYKTITTVPHLTIGKQLEERFVTAYHFLREQSYNQTFIADGILLLRRNNQNKYEPVQAFPFLSKSPAQLSFLS